MKQLVICIFLPVLFFVLLLFSSTIAADEQGFMVGMTKAHNTVRSKVGIQELIWSDGIADYAQQWAGYLATKNSCRMKHRPWKGEFAQRYGENLYWASSIHRDSGKNDRQDIQPEDVVVSWAGEKKHYDYQNNSCKPGKSCGHYTQVVWKNSERLGCAMAFCADNSQIWVCNYDPPGNFTDELPY